MKKNYFIVIYIISIFPLKGMEPQNRNCLGSAWQTTLQFFNLQSPSRTVEHLCANQHQTLTNLLREDESYYATLAKRSGGPIVVTTDNKTVDELLQEMNDASAEQARLQLRQGKTQRYKNLATALVNIMIGGAYIGYNIWDIESENNENRTIIESALQFWGPFWMIIQGSSGVVKYFKDTDGKILVQAIREGNAKSELYAKTLKNQERLLERCKKSSDLEAQLSAMEVPSSMPISTASDLKKEEDIDETGSNQAVSGSFHSNDGDQ